jgi:hypothetical protein
VLQAVGNQAQCQRLHGRGGLLLSAAVGRHAGERCNIGQPAPILFAVVLDGQGEPFDRQSLRYVPIMPRYTSTCLQPFG